MATYHLSVKTISRSAGRSATAAAAYRSASVVHDQRTGLTHDYTKKQGVISASIITPDGSPAWASDREGLWNHAEAAENRKNSVTAREFEIALPAELSSSDRAELAHEFAAELSERHQVAVDIAIHAPGKDGDQRNHHAHLLLTTRTLGADGFGKKTRELDSRKSGEVARWRERWADLTNAKLERAGKFDRVDHRSHRERGIEDEPSIHNGPTATAMERRGEQSDRGKLNQAIRNGHAERRRIARAIVEAEEKVTAIRRSQQAREQARQQQASTPPAQSRGAAAAVAALRDMKAPPASGRVAEWRAGRQEQAARERALAGLAKFHSIVGPRAAELSSQAVAAIEAVQVQQQKNNEAQRELAAARPRAPGLLGRIVGGGGRYRRREAEWVTQARELSDTGRRLREQYETERQAHGNAGNTAARELARENPALVRLAEKGMAIEQAERKAREVERQRQREAKRQEQAKAQQLARIERDAKRRMLKQTRETGKQPTREEIKAGIKAQLEAEREQAEREQNNERDRPRRSRGPSMGM